VVVGRKFTRAEIADACHGLDALRAQTAELDRQAVDEAEECIACGWDGEDQWRIETVGRRACFVQQPTPRHHYATIWTPARGRVTYATFAALRADHGPR
jgi:hypothetical protein